MGIHMYKNIQKHELVIHDSSDESLLMRKKDFCIDTLRIENEQLKSTLNTRITDETTNDVRNGPHAGTL